MSNTTYLHFYAPTPSDLSAQTINEVISILGVKDIVKVTRCSEGLRQWDFLETGDEEWPDYEILGQRIEPGEAGSYFQSGKCFSIDCVKGHPSDRCAQLAHLLHEHFPEELAREFYLNNLVVNAGPHDIFEDVENPRGRLFARTTFSVAFWGYRHPANLEELRDFVFGCDLVREIQKDLAGVTQSPIEYCLYLT